MSHTKGPWIAVDGTGCDIAITSQNRLDNSKGVICEINTYFTGVHGAEQEANKRLIASAPELLEALKVAKAAMQNIGVEPYMLSMQSDFDEPMKIVDAAINAASGE